MNETARDRITQTLAGRTGRTFWRSLEELADTAAFREMLAAEFPALLPSLAPTGLSRRTALKALAGTLALAGLTGCDGQPDETALPYVTAPEGDMPGIARFYATAVRLGGYAQPVMGKTHSGRPVKLEGNPGHPATGGGTDLYTQAALLDLYDHDRSQGPRRRNQPTIWAAVDTALHGLTQEMDASRGEGLRLLTGPVTSPTLIRQMTNLRQRWPNARWHILDPLGGAGRLEAARLAFGRPLQAHALLDQAAVLVCLDDDPLGPGPAQATLARRWARRRLASQAGQGGCRLFVAEPSPTLTGARADRRLVAAPHRLPVLLNALEGGAPDLRPDEVRWLAEVRAALAAHPGQALVTVGPWCDPALQAQALRLNARLGAVDHCLRFTAPLTAQAEPWDDLVRDMAAGRVRGLVILEANPAHAAPDASAFRDALARVPFTLHAGPHLDETAAACQWHAPLAHDLESWSDARAVDGMVSLIQPLVRPWLGVRGRHALLDGLLGGAASDHAVVQATWRPELGADFDRRWTDALVKGFIPDSAPPWATPTVIDTAPASPLSAAGGLTLLVRPDPTLWDGASANNAWLQETPKPLSKVTWGNVVHVSPHLAALHGLKNGDEMTVTAGAVAVTGPAWILPGQEADTITLTLGYGRRLPSQTADGLGYDAYPLSAGPATLTPTGRTRDVATTQRHHAMEGEDFVRTVPVGHPTLPPEVQTPSFYPDTPPESPSWGMAIDLDLCIGCNACVVACVAENNVPMVGAELVAMGREMHWLRVDTYHEGDPAAPATYFQPVPCMHCEQAPCEMGCPVNAAVHSHDGLNLQVYNRCIGTRTCSSYCPYKVRRFNWYDYTAKAPEPVKAQRNPDVTVRQRGVMEKCTYCIQRISAARIQAKLKGEAIPDGAVVPACQQACPTQAITFGDVTDPQSQVSRRKASPRNYSLVPEAGTRPRTTYLARIEPDDGGAA
ncbi:molybdopterin-containing oxidoreductase family iron-sulfur binding subunit [Nitrospirillum amazonense]|uniref:Molybdopterin-containing oxidoreductase family iron-sulfur binding subunit n=1 Tax=Nitrospirillum amazonense TaxID=28077 RepID=A0A560ESZ1_9PROT|nr:TAT-variant-translocated molybdopterin oxidoreductase [Nitrospirillum amazonense]TWB12437.1 molybdopterin-containing oxidoreductase family iron-sulfur binding subunit [Nitrospirillum amazonense]